MMKTKIYFIGLIAALLAFLGILFKMQHWPGASIALSSGIIVLLFVFLPLALRSSYKAEGREGSGLLYIVTWITCLVVLGSMLFKIQHWPGAGYLLLVAIPFPYVVFLPVYLTVTGRNHNHSIYNTVAILFLLTTISALSALLSLGITKEKLTDSLLFADNYNRAESALVSLTVDDVSSPLALKIDEALKILDEYEEVRLLSTGASRQDWVDNPEVLMQPSLKHPATMKYEGRADALHSELQSALSDIIERVKSDRVITPLTDNIDAVLNMKKSSGPGYLFADDLFRSGVRPWVFVYLDGLRVNLMMLRLTTA